LKDSKTRKLKVTQLRSTIGSNWRKKRTMEAIGLRKIRHSVIHPDTKSIRGMTRQVRELVEVEEVKEKSSAKVVDKIKD